MSLFGALINKAEVRTPVPMTGRSSGGLFGALTVQRAASQQLGAMEAVGTVFGIVDKLATSISLVDWHLWRKAKSGKKEDRVEVTSHAALDLWNKPNRFTTRQELVEAAQQHQELMGEVWLTVARNQSARTIPLELWCVRPDRMEPVPSYESFLAGYIYRSPDGEQIPLGLDDVLFMRRPDPNNPYRGLGPIKPALVDIDSARYAAEWNRNFFLNSAEPGGIVEIDRRLSDDEFNELVTRWREQHQGTAQAHRVAILEQVKWVDRKYTMRDMQFTQLRGVTSAAIREAFGFPKFLTGDVTDVNRANADASMAMYAQFLLIPRLERWKQMLNVELLPMFGTTAAGMEFDYDNPVPANSEAENAALTAKAGAIARLVPIGFDAKETLAWLGLPDIAFNAPAPPAPPAAPLLPPPPAGVGVVPPPVPAADAVLASALRRLTNQAPADDPALRTVQADWESALNGLAGRWQTQVTPGQRDQIDAQVRAAVAAGDVAALSQISVDSSAAAAVLAAGLSSFAGLQSQRMLDELAVQGAPVDGVTAVSAAAPGGMSGVATAVAGLLAAGLAGKAATAAVAAFRPGVSVDAVVTAVDKALDGLGDRALRDQLGGALSQAQNEARLMAGHALETSLGGSPGDPNNPDEPADDEYIPQVLYVAKERKNGNVCPPCKDVDGTEYPSWIAAWIDYGGGIYRGCEGLWRCRGTVKATWNPAAGQ